MAGRKYVNFHRVTVSIAMRTSLCHGTRESTANAYPELPLPEVVSIEPAHHNVDSLPAQTHNLILSPTLLKIPSEPSVLASHSAPVNKTARPSRNRAASTSQQTRPVITRSRTTSSQPPTATRLPMRTARRVMTTTRRTTAQERDRSKTRRASQSSRQSPALRSLLRQR